MLLLSGKFINEWYFIWLVTNHADCDTIGAWLHSWLPLCIAHFKDTDTLPTVYQMATLYNTISVRAHTDGYSRWLIIAPHEMHPTPSNLRLV